MSNFISLNGTVFQPELRKTQSGKSIFAFNLSYYDGKGADGKAKYGNIRVKAWEALGENAAAILKEKDRAIVCGKLTHEKWQAKDGSNRSREVIIASSIGQEISPFAQNGGGFGSENYPDDEQIPF